RRHRGRRIRDAHAAARHPSLRAIPEAVRAGAAVAARRSGAGGRQRPGLQPAGTQGLAEPLHRDQLRAQRTQAAMTPLPENIQGVLFDLDGTLLDSAADLYGALVEQCAEEGEAAPDYDAVRQVVSRGSTAILQQGFP